MKLPTRALTRWALGTVSALLAGGSLLIAVLVFPSPLFAHSQSYGTYRVYSDEAIPAELGRVIEDLERRIQGMEHPAAAASQRIYLCGPKKYSFFTFLTRRNPESLAMGLSVARETFVSVERVRLFSEKNRGVLRHTRFEGSLAEVVAHEIAHFNSIQALGLRSHLSQPLWKSEGWAEYQANLSAIRADPDYDLRRRIERLLDDGYWSRWHGAARRMWEAQLLVEFLGEVRGYHLSDLSRSEVTLAGTREQMMAWYRDHVEETAPMG